MPVVRYQPATQRYRTSTGLFALPPKRKNRRRIRKRVTAVPKQLGLLGNMVKTKIKYGETYAISGSAGFTHYTYRANSCYDPYAGAGGGQPRGFDQLMAFFGKGHCYQSYMNVRCINTSSSGQLICGITVSNDGTAPTTVQDLIEQRRSKYRVLGLETGGGNNKYIKARCNYAYTKGVKRLDPLDHFFTAGADDGGTPSYVLSVGSLDLSADFTGYIFLEIIYCCVLFDKNTMPSS